MIAEKFDDAYFAEIQDHLKVMNLATGLSLNAKLGSGN